MTLVRRFSALKISLKLQQLEDVRDSAQYISNTIFFHQSRLVRDIKLQNTYIVLFKSPRDVLQINTPSQQLGLGSQSKDWYTKATSIPYGHLLIDLTPKTVDSLQFCTNSGSISSIFFLPQLKQQTTFLSDEHTTSLYSDNVPKLFPELQKNLPKKLSERIYSVPKQVPRKHAQRRTARYSKTRRNKVSRRNSSAHSKKNWNK